MIPVAPAAPGWRVDVEKMAETLRANGVEPRTLFLPVDPAFPFERVRRLTVSGGRDRSSGDNAGAARGLALAAMTA